MGFLDFRKKLDKTDMAKGDVLFAATGVTDGNLLSGVRFAKTGITTHTLVMRSSRLEIRWRSWPLLTSQSRIMPSRETETILLPSGEMAASATGPLLPVNRRIVPGE